MKLTEPSSGDPPDILDLTRSELDAYWPVWLLWINTERKFLPTWPPSLEAQPVNMMRVLFLLDGIYEKMVFEQQKKQSTSEGS